MLRLCVVCWNDSLFEETGPKCREEQREESARADESRQSLAVWDKDWMDSLGVSNYTWAKVNKSERWCCPELFHPANSIPALSLMDSLCTQPSLSSNMSDMGWKSENVYLMLKGSCVILSLISLSLTLDSCGVAVSDLVSRKLEILAYLALCLWSSWKKYSSLVSGYSKSFVGPCTVTMCP